ncbi:LacI family DNA-binding transcriptional regulator [Arsenicicoccus piscis]|uniref:Alanine racemase n=1 Tax=Arsenicicoccus piscis TaxID=673954 RepID=A0ABQ6HU24_9MICO|nr:LacI family DNA-binding transcriptional regulator [Arsenicicoccus piscis]MCH8626434.1 LacI family DNA-binding transcriptional regulator [Arsenicicoccus piscis]GMA21060.1 alanine racemase [Arsenicicoccus piscis]
MRAPTIRDVAAMAGVAASTVSVVLNEVPGARVSTDTRRRIHEAAAVLGYTANPHARSLRSASSRSSVALINDRIAYEPYGGDLIRGAQEACQRLGATLLVLSTTGDPQREQEALDYARAQRYTAVVLASLTHVERELPTSVGSGRGRRGLNLVLANARPSGDSADSASGPHIPYVVPDERSAGRAAATELLAAGHRQIGALMVGPCLPGVERLAGFAEALAHAGLSLDPELVVTLDEMEATAHGGYAVASRLLDRPGHSRPTALFCFNDRMAMGAYRAAAERGLRIPDDLSVVGYDNLEPIADSLYPGLTTIALPYCEIGEQAVEIALDREHPAHTPGSSAVVLDCPLVCRESVAPAPMAHAQPSSRNPLTLKETP